MVLVAALCGQQLSSSHQPRPQPCLQPAWQNPEHEIVSNAVCLRTVPGTRVTSVSFLVLRCWLVNLCVS